MQQYFDEHSIQTNADFWLDVKRIVAESEMSPKKEKQPSGAERALIVGWIKWSIDNVDPSLVVRDPGFVTRRREIFLLSEALISRLRVTGVWGQQPPLQNRTAQPR